MNDVFTDFTSFRLGALSRDLARYFNSRLAEYNLTIGQALVLYQLLDNEKSPIKDIASVLELDSPSVSRLIDKLYKDGLVERVEDPDDRRALNISLTAKGIEAAKKALKISADFNELIKKTVGNKDYSSLELSLNKIKNLLRKEEEK